MSVGNAFGNLLGKRYCVGASVAALIPLASYRDTQQPGMERTGTAKRIPA